MGKRPYSDLFKVFQDTSVQAGFSPLTVVSEMVLTKGELGGKILAMLQDRCDAYLDVICGRTEGDTIGYPGYGNTMCFTRRFVCQQSTDVLPGDQGASLSTMIEDVFYLGFIFHMVDSTFPTRQNYESVDVGRLMPQFVVDSLVANIKLRGYGAENGFMRIFDAYFYQQLDPFIKRNLRIGWWKRGLCRSYFTNLYYAGAYLGMMFDMETR